MKSVCLIIFFILSIFIITTEANVEGQLYNQMIIQSGGYKTWLNPVTGYDKNDSANGYAGLIGEPITSLSINGKQYYTVHLMNSNEWLEQVDGFDPG